MTDVELDEAKEEIRRKIAEGILPEGAEIAVCKQPRCGHWAHRLKKGERWPPIRN